MANFGLEIRGKNTRKLHAYGHGNYEGTERGLGMLLPPLDASESPQHGVAQIDLNWKTLPQIGGLPATVCGDGLGIT